MIHFHDVCKISLRSVENILRQSTANYFGQISNSIKISLVGRVPDISIAPTLCSALRCLLHKYLQIPIILLELQVILFVYCWHPQSMCNFMPEMAPWCSNWSFRALFFLIKLQSCPITLGQGHFSPKNWPVTVFKTNGYVFAHDE